MATNHFALNWLLVVLLSLSSNLWGVAEAGPDTTGGTNGGITTTGGTNGGTTTTGSTNGGITTTGGTNGGTNGGAQQSQSNMVPSNPNLKSCIEGTRWRIENPTANINSSHRKCDETRRELKMVVAPGAEPLTGYYNLKGQRCANITQSNQVNLSNQCVFEVKAFWKAICLDEKVSNRCAKAKEFEIDYQVTQVGPSIPGIGPSSAVRAGTGSGFQRPISKLSIASVLGTSTLGSTNQAFSLTCAQLYPNSATMSVQIGIDQAGAPICGNPLQDQLCQMETAQVNAFGGATTKCSPNIVVVKLHGNNKTVNQCLAASGSLVDFTTSPATELTASVSGGVVTIANQQVNANNVASHNGKYFCSLAASGTNTACPAGWNNFLQWKKTNSVTCDDGTDVGPGCSGTCPNTSVTVGGGGWINSTIPEQIFYRWKKRVFGCNCQHYYLSGTSPCRATMNRVGCI